MVDYVKKDLKEFPKLRVLKKYLQYVPGGFIAGGVFKNLFLDQPIKDIDIFFENPKAWEDAVAGMDPEIFKEVYRNNRVVCFKHLEDETLLDLVGGENLTIPYQDAENTISKFDFTVTKFALVDSTELPDLDDDMTISEHPEETFEVIYHPEFFEHLHLKRLVIEGDLLRPYSTFDRTYRYTRYGYSLCMESKIALVEEMLKTSFDPTNLEQSFYAGVD